jgi:hypothetical protein
VPLKTTIFLALVLTAVALAPSAAHLFELPNKIGLSQDQYFIVQNIYRGWALLGSVVIAAILINLLLVYLLWAQLPARWFALLAFVCVLGGLAVFFTWTYPANVATDNWTAVPENWRALRTQWEYSHAANAVLTFVAFCSLTLAALTARY